MSLPICFARTVLPLVGDVCYPTPARGLSYRWFDSAAARLESDMVFAMALTYPMIPALDAA